MIVGWGGGGKVVNQNKVKINLFQVSLSHTEYDDGELIIVCSY